MSRKTLVSRRLVHQVLTDSLPHYTFSGRYAENPTIQTLPLTAIVPPERNPRSAIDPAGIEGLAASIKTDGLLQNLVVIPLEDGEQHYRLVSGERRYRALTLLAERGELSRGYEVPVDIRQGLSPDDTLRLATVENLQREQLPPLDEATALAGLIQHGTTLEDASAKTGLSATTIKRRLALLGLCGEAKEALVDGALMLAQAEALTLGSHEAQQRLLHALANGYDYPAEAIREMLLDSRPSVAMAIFLLDQYTGSFTTDLFAEDTATYFDDVEQFFALQQQAVATLAEQHAETAAWVEVTESYTIPAWHYRDAGDGEPAGVLINLSPAGEVEIREGLAKRGIDPETAAATADTPAAPKKAPPAYSTPLCRDIAYHKSMAVQFRLLGDARKAKEVAAVLLSGASDAYHSPLRLRHHDCLQVFSLSEDAPAAYGEVEGQALAGTLALGLGAAPEEQPAWKQLLHARKDAVALYESVKTLSDGALDRLLWLLPVLCFGQGSGERLDTQDTLFNRVARDLEVDMREHWRPDTAFLRRRTRAQLTRIAWESGFTTRHGDPAAYKKAELVTALAGYFARVQDLDAPDPHERQGRDWLPEAMRFPATDPAADDASTGDNPPWEDA